jgi:hypothetical protein
MADGIVATIGIAPASSFDQLVRAYEAWGYKEGIRPEDTVWTAEEGAELIGIVRIAPEHGALVLRGMRVAESRRGNGTGTQMLAALTAWLNGRECWCVPYVHVAGFYGCAGFEEAELAAPLFLRERLAQYRGRGLKVTIMRRPGATAEHSLFG